ncbi:AzlD domain-containing protein [Aureimonas flava]|uniref:AzlD domain-containing protein n=1 Tax=Aureimonas flava TaxID=2320271 RepID=A0A3A1WMF9_9HYPH|nr:AzlD domain-containing protein [Aureimonas flava]RIY01556.1 AzlD domain-containing protein [Aureimonas flava]
MTGLDFHGIDAIWWPYLFILLAGWLPTDVWRWLGVFSAGRLNERSPAVALARTIATSLVAAVIGRLVLLPGESLEAIPLAIRIAALAVGFAAYYWLGRKTLIAILFAEIVLLGVPWGLGII